MPSRWVRRLRGCLEILPFPSWSFREYIHLVRLWKDVRWNVVAISTKIRSRDIKNEEKTLERSKFTLRSKENGWNNTWKNWRDRQLSVPPVFSCVVPTIFQLPYLIRIIDRELLKTIGLQSINHVISSYLKRFESKNIQNTDKSILIRWSQRGIDLLYQPVK